MEPESPVLAIDEERASRDVAYFLETLAAFLDYGEADRLRLMSSAIAILPQTQHILDAVYGRLLSCSTTRKYFVDADGQPNQAFLEKRRKTLFEWLSWTAAGRLDARMAGYLQEMARAHLETEAGGAGPVPLADIEALYGVLEAKLAGLFATFIAEPEELAATIGSWSKMMAAQRAVLARVYGLPRPFAKADGVD